MEFRKKRQVLVDQFTKNQEFQTMLFNILFRFYGLLFCSFQNFDLIWSTNAMKKIPFDS